MLLCLTPERRLLKSESQRSALCQGRAGELDRHACYFPSLSSVIIEKGQIEQTGTLSHLFSRQQRRRLSPVHTWTARQRGSLMRSHGWSSYRPHIRGCTKRRFIQLSWEAAAVFCDNIFPCILSPSPYFEVKVIKIEDCFHMTCRFWV